QSELVLLDGVELRTRTLRRFPRPYVFSRSAGGGMFGRPSDPSMRPHRPGPTRDILISPTGAVTTGPDLRHYDCFNHYLRLDGASTLYFLQGTPKSSHERKNLCELTPETQRAAARWPLGWGRYKRRHLKDCAGCVVGDAVVLACRLYPDP